MLTAAPSLFEPVSDGVFVVRDDAGRWDGDMSRSITHQSSAGYQAKKILDLVDVQEDLWNRTRAVRLSIFFMVRDYSPHQSGQTNGLDEAFEIVVNGKIHRYPTHCGAPVFRDGQPPAIGWHEFEMSKPELNKSRNEIVLRKAPSDKNDDYLYLGIDRSQARGNSFVAFDGRTWRQDKLTVPGGEGEYMMRLYLVTRDLSLRARWNPGPPQPLNDPEKLILYAGAHGAEQAAQGVRLVAGTTARLEWHPLALDLLTPLVATIEAEGPAAFAWLDEAGNPVPPIDGEGTFQPTLPAARTNRISGIEVRPRQQPILLKEVGVEAARALHPLPSEINLCPPIAAPAFSLEPRPPSRTVAEDFIMLENAGTPNNAGLHCRFETGERLRLVSLFNHNTQGEMVNDPDQVYLFLVEIAGRRFAGSRDFRCDNIRWTATNRFVAELSLPDPPLMAALTASMEDEGLRLGLTLTNAGKSPISFKLAFPHLAGLVVSELPPDDYYFFPSGGGIIADTPAYLRRGYGDHEALYQIIDLFSPARGGGLYLRIDDTEGWHKTLALRKHLQGVLETDYQRLIVRATPEYQWTNTLAAVPGTSLACEYLRRARGPGESFTPAPAVLAAHPGDWHFAMRAYSAWAHRVWNFRPFPSRLQNVHNMIAAGWGQSPLFRKSKYRMDFLQPSQAGFARTMTDCLELMSWWDWSPLGPWSTPFDQLTNVLSADQIKRWQPYFVKDPVTGQTMWSNQPGDYDGYNERFGGLPAFRQAIADYRKSGALVTLYTDPFRLDDASKAGQKFGRQWGVVGPDGEHTTAYEVWNPCHDVAEVRQWVADTMRRVMRETGADGIRLDEYGHRGWVCFSTNHAHTFAERGVSQWQKAVAEATRGVRAAMDEVAPGSVLTVEHPGYDYLLPHLEGCITYDLTAMATPLRPLECNLQRFYFPECKVYELDNRGVDPDCRKKFWNAVGSFGRYYPVPYYVILAENADAYHSRDCEPLLRTPAQAPHIYVNRFSAGDKTLYHLYNASGHTFEGPALAIVLDPDKQHLFDLLNAREIPKRRAARSPEREGDLSEIQLYLPRNEVACIARLPRLLEVRREEAILKVEVRLPEGSGKGTLVLATRDGERLATQTARPGLNEITLPASGKKPACVKLLAEDVLLDAFEVPESTGK